MEDILRGRPVAQHGQVAQRLGRVLAVQLGDLVVVELVPVGRLAFGHRARCFTAGRAQQFGVAVANALVAEGAVCMVTARPVPAPMLAWAVRDGGFDLGVSVTASHDPAADNGLKLRMGDAGPPSVEVARRVHALATSFTEAPMPRFEVGAGVEFADPWSAYTTALRGLVDRGVINQAAPRLAVDAMHGTTAGLLGEVLTGTDAEVIEVRSDPDPRFGGIRPEPRPDSLEPLRAAMHAHGCQLGVAHDGDGDRIVAVVPGVGYLSPGDVLVLLAWYLASCRGMPGAVVASTVTTRRAARVAELLDRPFHEVAVGWGRAADLIRAGGVLVAGEENGGIGLGAWLPDRDGTAAAVLLVELAARAPDALADAHRMLAARLGASSVHRRDIATSGDADGVVARLAADTVASVAGRRVVNQSTTDGLKLTVQGDAWVALRASGTEPLLRVYAEADTIAETEALALAAETMARQAANHDHDHEDSQRDDP